MQCCRSKTVSFLMLFFPMPVSCTRLWIKQKSLAGVTANANAVPTSSAKSQTKSGKRNVSLDVTETSCCQMWFQLVAWRNGKILFTPEIMNVGWRIGFNEQMSFRLKGRNACQKGKKGWKHQFFKASVDVAYLFVFSCIWFWWICSQFVCNRLFATHNFNYCDYII